MADEVKVKPTPIQRNAHDVAMELVELHIKRNIVKTVDEFQKLYLQFYSVASVAENMNFKDMKEFIPEELKEIIEQNY